MRLNYIDNCDNIVGMQRLPDACIDLTVTSPPYDNLRTYKGFSWGFEALAAELYRVTKPGGVVVWIVNDATVKGSETGTSFRQALHFKDVGFNLHDTMIWKKTGLPFPETTRYYPNFEYMFVFSKGRPRAINLIEDRPNKHAGVLVHGTNRQPDGGTTTTSAVKQGRARKIKPVGVRFNVWEMPEAKSNTTGHPAVFPEALVRDHIISWSNPGAVVLDPFMGSGTTAVAALKNGRNYIGFELSPEYCQNAQQRIAETIDELLTAEEGE